MSLSPDYSKTNHFLGIGVQDYDNTTYPTLNNAEKDISAVKSALIKSYQFEEENCTTLFGPYADRAGILRHLSTLVAKLTKDHNLIVYFAGHGYYQEHLSQGYWIPFQEKAIEGDHSNWISNSNLYDYIRPLKCHHFLLLSDSCFSGSFLLDNYRIVPTGLTQYASRWALCSGLKEPVSDGPKGENSPFATAILQYLEQPASKEKGAVISEMINSVRQNVTVNEEQSPLGDRIKYVGDGGGEFIILPKGGPISSIAKSTSLNFVMEHDDSTEIKIHIEVSVHVTWGKQFKVSPEIQIELGNKLMEGLKGNSNRISQETNPETGPSANAQINSFISFQVHQELTKIVNSLDDHPFVDAKNKTIISYKNELFSILKHEYRIGEKEREKLVAAAIQNTLYLLLLPEEAIQHFLFYGSDILLFEEFERRIKLLPIYGSLFEKVLSSIGSHFNYSEDEITQSYVFDQIKVVLSEIGDFTASRDVIFQKLTGLSFDELLETYA